MEEQVVIENAIIDGDGVLQNFDQLVEGYVGETDEASKIISIEGKCGVGKSTWLREHGIITEETVDFKVDERTHNTKDGMIPLEEQLEFVTHKIEQFKEKLVELEQTGSNIYIDGSMLYNVSYGAGYYWWYHTTTTKEKDHEKTLNNAFEFVNNYLEKCDELIKDLPEGWQDKLESLILIPEDEDDLREKILKRGRPSEVANIDNMLRVNEYFYDYLIKILDKYNIKYSFQVVANRVD